MEDDIRITDMEKLRPVASEYLCLDDYVVYAHMSSELHHSLYSSFHQPLKVDGSIFIHLTKGSMRLNCNFTDFTVTAPAIVSLPQGAVVEIVADPSANVELFILAFARTFMQDINISFSAISGTMVVERKSPVLELEDRESLMVSRYMSLVKNTLADQYNTTLTKHIVSSVATALFYQTMLFLYRRIEPGNDKLGHRRSSYVHDFIKLVHLYYNKERSVNFYASKLCISPKYLSLLVKEATGVSAARWIDRFVITEAKTLLRFSGKNIQQVAYALNFPNQSSFGKYFKHLTGMSPTDFQKS